MIPHLLTIDDEEDIRVVLHEALTVAGYRVTAVATAAEALQVLRSDPPQLVLTDLQLEDSDGFEVVEAMKTLAPAVPVILLTGVVIEPADIPAGISQKIACYIPKTSPLDRILREVKKHLPQ